MTNPFLRITVEGLEGSYRFIARGGTWKHVPAQREGSVAVVAVV